MFPECEFNFVFSSCSFSSANIRVNRIYGGEDRPERVREGSAEANREF